MKELFNTLSNSSQFFTEKRFIYEVGKGIQFSHKENFSISERDKKPKGDLSADEKNEREVGATKNAGNEKMVKTMRQEYVDNPNRFKEFARLSQKVTANFAKLGIPRPMLGENDPDGMKTRGLPDTVKQQTFLDEVIPKITAAFNKNKKTQMFFFKALVDIHLYTKIVPNKAKRLQIYQKLATKLEQISPKTMVLLPNLKTKLLIGSKKRKTKPRRIKRVS